MKRILVILAIVVSLVVPVVAMADDQTIPPEANWTPTPLARQTVDVNQLASLLVEKGMITPQEYAQIARSRLSSTSPQGQARVWTWGEIDHKPAVRIAGSN
jgi:hypothetical protein